MQLNFQISSDEEPEKGPPSKRKKTTYNQNFTPKWLEENPEFRAWLTAHPQDKKKSFCKVCGKALKGNITGLRKHQDSGVHKRNMDCLKQQSTSASPAEFVNRMTEKSSLSNNATRAELALSVLMVEGGVAVSFMDRLIPALKKHIPDSKIVEKLACNRTKATGFINVVGCAGEEDLSAILRKTRFAFIVDESTDRTTTKFLIVVVRYFSPKHGRPVEEFFALPKVEKEAGAKQLKDLIVAELAKRDIPIQNMIGFGSDNASVMTGLRSGLATLLKQDIPWLVSFGCICHSFALCSTAACELALPPQVTAFAHDVYNFIAVSPKRTAEFEESQAFVKAEKRKILYPSKTRWLVMEKVVKRILDQWNALENYFAGFLADPKAVEAREIYNGIRSVDLKLYYCFLGYVLPIVNNMNAEFQSEEVKSFIPSFLCVELLELIY